MKTIDLTKTYPYNLTKQIFKNESEDVCIYLPNILIVLATLTHREEDIIKLHYAEEKNVSRNW